MPLLKVGIADIWRYRDLLFLFVHRDIVAFYKQTILGPLWFFIQPLLTTVIYLIVFGQIAGIPTDGIPQVLFYLSGITLWNYFSDSFVKTATTFRDNSDLFSKVYFPRILSPLSIILSNLTRFGLQLLLFLLMLVYYVSLGEAKPNAFALCLPVTIAIMAMLGLAFGMFFSAMTAKYRDLVFLLQFGIQLLMYATPVIYPTSEIPSGIASVLQWNPLAPLFELTRYGFLGAGNVTLGDMAYSFAFALISLFISLIVFNQVQRTSMDTV